MDIYLHFPADGRTGGRTHTHTHTHTHFISNRNNIGASGKFRKANISFVMFVSAPTGRIFTKFYISIFFFFRKSAEINSSFVKI